MRWIVPSRFVLCLLVAVSSGIVAAAAQLDAQSPPPSSDQVMVEEIAFPNGAQAAVGHPFEMVVFLDAARAGVCTSARWLVTAPDGTVHDVFGGHPQIGCSKEPGRRFVRAVFWNQQPGPADRKPWPMIAGRYQVRVEVSTYAASAAELARGMNQALGPPVVRSAEFAAVELAPTETSSSPPSPAPSGNEMLIGTTAPQNLAAAFLSNRNRLELLDAFDPDSKSRVTLAFGGEVVTRANVAEIRERFQQRQQAYAAEIERRGVPHVAGKYRFEEAESCRSATSTPLVVYLVQNGFSIEMRRDTADGERLNSGVATGGTLTLGRGDFSPDLYAYGPLDPTGRVQLQSFAGAGCPVVMTPIRQP